MSALESLLRDWDGLGVLSRYDAPSGAWFFIALHDDTLGSLAGGTRLATYLSPAAALEDAQRLAAGMTRKFAVARLPKGGAKAVIAAPPRLRGEERTALLRRYARLVEYLGGVFSTGPDLGITREDLLIMGQESRFIHGVDAARGTVVDSGPFTARGVARGLSAAVRRRLGVGGLEGVRVAIEGLGKVGAVLARMLAAEGAAIFLADTDRAKAEALAAELGGRVVESAAESACDVYAPCAVGATLSRDSIPELRCSVVAGGANNQLAEREDAERLAERGILWAPDYVINGGGVIGMLATEAGCDEAEIAGRIDQVGVTLSEIFTDAAERDESPLLAAERLAESVLAEARGRR